MFRDYRNLLLVAPGEGASATMGECLPFNDGEAEELLNAWSQERKERIEASIYLDQARKLLLQILAKETITPMSRKKAMRLLVAIDESCKKTSLRDD